MNIFDFVKIFRKAKTEYFADKNKARKCINNYKILENQIFEKYSKTKNVLDVLSKDYASYPKEWQVYINYITRLIRYGTTAMSELNKDYEFSQTKPENREKDYLPIYLTHYNYVDRLLNLYNSLKINREFCESYISDKNYQQVMDLYNEDINWLLKEENKRLFSSANVFNIN